MTHLLYVDLPDENKDQFGSTLLGALRSRRQRVTIARDSASLSAGIAINRPDAVLIDLIGGAVQEQLDICRRLRAWSTIPVLMMSTCQDESIKVEALDR